jgi:hypothetical protein
MMPPEQDYSSYYGGAGAAAAAAETISRTGREIYSDHDRRAKGNAMMERSMMACRGGGVD